MLSSQEVIFSVPDPQDLYEESLNLFLSSRLNKVFTEFVEEVAKHGYKVELYSKKSILEFTKMQPKQIDSIADYYQNWMSWIQMSEPEIDRKPRRELEMEFAKRSLNFYGYSADEAFWKTLRDDQVIEIYGPEMIQLYRSLNFFKFCGYSLLDISLFQWYLLWERPKKIMQQINEDVGYVLKSQIGEFKFTVPRHMMLETMNTGETINFVPRATEVQFQYMGILRKSANPLDAPEAFICSSVARTIAEGNEIENIRIL